MKKKRHFNKKLLLPLSVFAIVLAALIAMKITENGTFTVLDYSQSEPEIATYKHFFFAKRKLDSLDENAKACIQNEKKKVVAIKSGIVNFTTKDVSENTIYTTTNNEEGYLNGNYGSDGLYITTSSDGKKVLFMMSGVQGWVDVDDINLLFYDPSYNLSSYSRADDSLVHQVCLDVLNNSTTYYSIGKAPDFLKQDKTYYSYDGHYFYEDFQTMSADVRNESTANAVNEEPYYNFYQYVPHRTLTSLDQASYNEYLYRIAGIDSSAQTYPCPENESVLYDSAPLFYAQQDEVYVNASMMFSLGCNESGYGKSQYAIEQHNIFGHAAYDENPDQATMYADLADCIHQHAYYFIQQSYANPTDWRYHGSWFGDKESGINVQYASDPYWGEKAASIYYSLDQGHDLQNLPIKTLKCTETLDVKSKDGTTLYSYEKGDIASFSIIKETSDGYEVMLEAPTKNNTIDTTAPYNKNMRGTIVLEH